MHIKKNDMVQVVSGAAAGKRGKVLDIIPEKNRVIVEGLRYAWKHVRPDRQKGIPGGRIQKEMSIASASVMLFCDTCERPRRARKGSQEGRKIRVCVKCGKPIGATV